MHFSAEITARGITLSDFLFWKKANVMLLKKNKIKLVAVIKII